MVLSNVKRNNCLYFWVTAINGFLIMGFGILIVQSFRHEAKKKMTAKWETDLRLSPYIRPKMYDLFLHPNLESGVFSGRVNILVKVETLQPYVALHIKGLNISSTRITEFKDLKDQYKEVKVKSAFEYKKNEFWIIIPQNELKIGLYQLRLDFNGELTNKIIGFYSSRYVDENGKNRVIVTSKFEPTFARQAFPCFDEPSFKAKYTIKIVRPSEAGFIALSNMNRQDEIKDSPAPNETTVVFAKSVEMSTYLACFIVCDFANLKPAISASGFPVTVYARRDQIVNMQFAREVALKVINYYVKYFDITYPLPKLDLIAIPDFVSGAMENWGLITFRETSILYNSAITSTLGQFSVALTIAHELAHMWFGNLVTMKWWDDLWLNEGYASYIEYKGVAKVHPEWNLDAMFLIHDLHSVLELDATLNSHPIVHEVVNPDQITEIFDKISYNKGASIIRMLEATIGEENFQKGVHSYLTSHKFSNAETKDLWYHMQQYTSGYNVSTFMGTWTQQMGFPLISVIRREEVVTFKQERFLADSTLTYNKNESLFGYQWDVPITYITSINHNPEMVWLHKDQESTSVTLPQNVSWIKVNYHQKGYYRVNYETLEWYKIINLLLKEHETVPEPDRANLLNDAFSLADAELIDYDIPLQMTNYLVNETSLVPWDTASTLFLSLRNRLLNTTAYNSSAVYIQNLLTPLEDKISDTDESSSFTERYLQASLFKLGCSVGTPLFLTRATTMFLQDLDNIDRSLKLNPDLSGTVYYYGIQNSDVSEWNKLWDLFTKEQNPQEKQKLMMGLTASRDAAVLERYLSLCKNENYVRSQDFLILLTYMASNPVGSSVVWNFVRNEWPFLVNRYTLNDRYLGQMVLAVTKNFATTDRYNEMTEFFAQYPEAGAGTVSRKQALERVALNIKWRQKHLTKLNDWFNSAVGEIQ